MIIQNIFEKSIQGKEKDLNLFHSILVLATTAYDCYRSSFKLFPKQLHMYTVHACVHVCLCVLSNKQHLSTSSILQSNNLILFHFEFICKTIMQLMCGNYIYSIKYYVIFFHFVELAKLLSEHRSKALTQYQ